MESSKVQKEETSDTLAKEGTAEVYLPKTVFYNPVQEFNRDLTIAIISVYSKRHHSTLKNKDTKEMKKNNDKLIQDSGNDQKPDLGSEQVIKPNGNDKQSNNEELVAGTKYENGIKIFEGLSATGLRSVRFGLEIPGVQEVIANDYDENAVSFIKKNIEHNKLDGLVRENCGDAAMVMYAHRKNQLRFHVIDLDPYGSPCVFLDSAVQAVKDDGLLCVTCTDTAILCGNAPETCWAKYGATSLRSKFCHEMALRIVLRSIESHANRYNCYITPLLSLSIDFYVRVFVKVNHGQAKVKHSASKTANVYQCTGCGSFALQRIGTATATSGGNFKFGPALGPPVGERCNHCGHSHHLGGPIWADAIHDRDFIQQVIDLVEKDKTKFKTAARIVGMLNVAKEELPDQPLYYINDQLSSVLHCFTPKLLQIRSAIMNAGYKVSLSHAAKNSIKTDAPNDVLWDIFRCWVKDHHPIKDHHMKPGTPTLAILSKEPSIKADFTVRDDANPDSRKSGLLRWQVNPEPDWGPKPRAKPTSNDEELVEKRTRLQGKKRKLNDSKDNEYTSNLKQYACKRYIAGECNHGDGCKYSHEESLIQAAQEKAKKS